MFFSREKHHLKKKQVRDLPGGPVVKDPPFNAGDAGSVPGQGTKITHAMGQLSPCTTTTEAQAPRASTPQEKAPQ